MLTDLLLRAYTFANRNGVLEAPWVKRQFARAYFLYKRYWEDPYAGLISSCPQLFRGGHIIDVGANIGYTATLFARVADRQAKVYAFEPDPSNFTMLSEMINTRGYRDKVLPIQAAVGERDGTVMLWRNPTSHADHRVWTPEFKAAVSDPSPELITVSLVSLDSFWAREQPRLDPCFIKIDVQGYEPPVCLGMQRILDSYPGLSVAFEYGPDIMKSLGFEPAALLDLFRSKGFAIYVIKERGRLEPLPDGRFTVKDLDRRGYLDLLASRNAQVLSKS